MSQFYCREDELRKLNKRYAGDKFECIVIYGRRRVGKTALINEFCKDKPTIFFSALNTTGKENLEALSKSIMSFEHFQRKNGSSLLLMSTPILQRQSRPFQRCCSISLTTNGQSPRCT